MFCVMCVLLYPLSLCLYLYLIAQDPPNIDDIDNAPGLDPCKKRKFKEVFANLPEKIKMAWHQVSFLAMW